MSPDFIEVPDSRPDHKVFEFGYLMQNYRLMVRDRENDTLSILSVVTKARGPEVVWHIEAKLDVAAAVQICDLIRIAFDGGKREGRTDAQRAMQGALGL